MSEQDNGHDSSKHRAEDERSTSVSSLRRLALRVRTEGTVHITEGDLTMVCMTVAEYEHRTLPASQELPAPLGDLPALSTTQARILRALHDGASAIGIADLLGLELNVLVHHLRTLRQRYAVSSTREAVVRALALGDIT